MSGWIVFFSDVFESIGKLARDLRLAKEAVAVSFGEGHLQGDVPLEPPAERGAVGYRVVPVASKP